MLTSLDTEATDDVLSHLQQISRCASKHTTPQISRLLRQHIETVIRDVAGDGCVADKIHESTVTKIELRLWNP